MKKTKIGIIGCGNISGAYLKTCPSFDILEVAACADLDLERARARTEEFGVPRAVSTGELLADPDIEIAVNLTTPDAHYSVDRAVLEAGKSVYSEKPLAVARQQGLELLDLARARGLRIGCAPDTFMGGGIQTCRKLIDDGAVGEPVAATAFMTCRGHESWHPAPEFYYKAGGGPVFDMGPYYLTALVNLLGPVERVTGSARITFPERTITSEPLNGKVIRVEVPTHVAGVLDFASGAVASLIMSFDVWAARLPRIEIYGTEGSLSVPDPNGFGGTVRLLRAGEQEWREVSLTHPYTDNWRGIGVADMAYAIRFDRPHRASGQLACHVLDIMQALHEASYSDRHVRLTTSCERPAPLPVGLPEGVLDRNADSTR
ncbi:MAG: Gfo/Idh/MocA family oxidoreductase [Kiritimatiellaeota bacterium]|nr:Gfo/Idh/MocA family oxidoreductase [Kiritimatiellota bacterium]